MARSGTVVTMRVRVLVRSIVMVLSSVWSGKGQVVGQQDAEGRTRPHHDGRTVDQEIRAESLRSTTAETAGEGSARLLGGVVTLIAAEGRPLGEHDPGRDTAYEQGRSPGRGEMPVDLVGETGVALGV